LNEEYKGYTFEGWVQPSMRGAESGELFFYTQVVLHSGEIALKRAYRAPISRLLIHQGVQQDASWTSAVFRSSAVAEAFTRSVLPRLRALVDQGGIPATSWPVESDPDIEPLL
jgi:hypothetical protein